jgi:hypothetical protein
MQVDLKGNNKNRHLHTLYTQVNEWNTMASQKVLRISFLLHLPFMDDKDGF